MIKHSSSWKTVLDFWFVDIQPAFWFKKDANFDQEIRDKFSDLYWAATNNELYSWRENPQGRLAEIIILDQFSRNMFRDSPQAFAFDSLAIALCQQAIQAKEDQKLPLKERSFLYMPLMHSESLVIHELAEEMFSQKGLEDNYNFEMQHKKIIEKFGRYPHRNKILNRESTPEEIEFLNQPNSSF